MIDRLMRCLRWLFVVCAVVMVGGASFVFGLWCAGRCQPVGPIGVWLIVLLIVVAWCSTTAIDVHRDLCRREPGRDLGA